MKLINQSAEYLPQPEGLEGIYKQIELCGRTSYLSWDKITDGSAKKFVDMLIKSKHLSCLEHGTVYLKMPIDDKTCYKIACYKANPYSRTQIKERKNKRFVFDYYITSNLRVLEEEGWLDDLEYLCEPTEYHERRLSVKVVTSRSVSHELVRHRSMSFTQESQRYIGYDKDKFSGEITYIIPSWLDWLDLKEGTYNDTFELDGAYKITAPVVCTSEDAFFRLLLRAEEYYMSMVKSGCKPQNAREILPNATKTTLVMTAFESGWRDFMDQRLLGKTGQPHPDMAALASLIKEQF